MRLWLQRPLQGRENHHVLHKGLVLYHIKDRPVTICEDYFVANDSFSPFSERNVLYTEELVDVSTEVDCHVF